MIIERRRVSIEQKATRQLAKFATFNPHQFAGQVANLGFWLAEVRHRLAVIDGYAERFERLKAAQKKHVSQHNTIEFSLFDPCCTQGRPSPPRRAPQTELKEARHNLREATYRFLVRAFRENMIEEAALWQTCDELGISVNKSDLKARI
ncbi:MAG TPA: hypothetical protein VK395_01250 [Gemmataceae bacterium]|nr:hypothetical protein [Gemmataceae bacterium]